MPIFQSEKKKINAKGPFTADKGDWKAYGNSWGQKAFKEERKAYEAPSYTAGVFADEYNWTETYLLLNYIK